MYGRLLAACGLLTVCAAPLSASGARPGFPFVLEPNLGQTAPAVRFLARGPACTLFFTDREIVVSGWEGVARLRFAGSDPVSPWIAREPLPGKSHYFSAAVRRHAPHYASLRRDRLYPGVDLAFYSRNGQAEFDFLVAAGADPSVIRLEITGAPARVLDDGGLAAGPLRIGRPGVFQDERPIPAAYRIETDGAIAIALAEWDRSRPLHIDPAIAYSTYLGGDGAVTGGNDAIRGVAADKAGNALVAGVTESPQFPVTPGAPYALYAGGPSTMFVAKLAPDGALVWSTYFGGTGLTIEAAAVAADSAGNAYVTGYSYNGNFPASENAIQKQRAGARDVFLLKLSPEGQVLYATLLGGDGDDYGTAVAAGDDGVVWIAGTSASARFPVTPDAIGTERSQFSTPILIRMDTVAGKLLYATYLPAASTIHALRLDARGYPLLAGDANISLFKATPGALRAKAASSEGFLIKLNEAGSEILYATFVGGNRSDSVRALFADPAGRIHLAGTTTSRDLPVTPEASQPEPGGDSDAFLLSLDETGTQVLHCTYLGGAGADTALAIAVGPDGTLYVSGETTSEDLPVSEGVPQTSYGGGPADVFYAAYQAETFNRMVLAYLGGSGEEGLAGMALDPVGDPWLAGSTRSGDFPVTEGAYQKALAKGGSDGWLAKLGSLGTTHLAATYFGGAGASPNEQAFDLALDAGGNVYLAGWSFSANFPVEGASDASTHGDGDAFVASLDSSGRTLRFVTFLGGAANDQANRIQLDAEGSVYVVGSTRSQDFPATEDAVQGRLRGGNDAFLAKLKPDGSELLYSTYLGGSGDDLGAGLALGPRGEIYVAGSSSSANFPVTADAVNSGSGNSVFLARFDPDTLGLVWAARLGGSRPDYGLTAAVDTAGNPCVAGRTESADFPVSSGAFQTTHGGDRDAFVVKFSPAGNEVLYATLLGGSGYEEIRRLVAAGDGEMYAAGYTNSRNFPVTPGAYQTAYVSGDEGFLVKLDRAGAVLRLSTLVSGSSRQRVNALAADGQGNLFLAGQTDSTTWPITRDTAVQTLLRGADDGFVLQLDPEGKQARFATFLGGSGADVIHAMAINAAGNPVVAGQTCSGDFPVAEDALQSRIPGSCNAFVAAIDLAAPTPARKLPRIDRVLHYTRGAVSVTPGSPVVFEGANLASSAVEAAKPEAPVPGPLPRALGGVSVFVSPSSTPMPLFSVSPERIVAQIPYDIAPNATVRVVAGDGDVTRRPSVTMEAPSWGIVDVLRANGTRSSPENRIEPNEVIRVLMIGFVADPQVKPPTGTPAPEQPVFEPARPWPYLQVGQPGTTDTSSCAHVSNRIAPGYVGVAEFRVRVPAQQSSYLGVWELFAGTLENPESNRFRIYPVIRPD